MGSSQLSVLSSSFLTFPLPPRETIRPSPVIAEIIPEAYDAEGRAVSRPFDRRRGVHPTLPMGRYVSQPLSVECKSIHDLWKFLSGCQAASDEELFGKQDYWQPPEEFEKRKAGDCEDFSLWTWRQLMAMGYDARFVFGSHGRYGTGHAWVMFFQDSKAFLVEPQYHRLGEKMPRLSTLSYGPSYSVAWDGKDLRYYAHKRPTMPLPWGRLLFLVPDWLFTWGWVWFNVILRLPFFVTKIWRRKRREIARTAPSARATK